MCDACREAQNEFENPTDSDKLVGMLTAADIKYDCQCLPEGQHEILVLDTPHSYQYIEQGVRFLFGNRGQLLSVERKDR